MDRCDTASYVIGGCSSSSSYDTGCISGRSAIDMCTSVDTVIVVQSEETSSLDCPRSRLLGRCPNLGTRRLPAQNQAATLICPQLPAAAMWWLENDGQASFEPNDTAVI